MLRDAVEGGAVYHRSYIGGQRRRVAHTELSGSAGNHLDHRIRSAFMQAQKPQGRAALTGRAKRALHHGVGHLLGQCGRVDQHGIDAAGLGNQRHDGAVFRGQRSLNNFGHRHRAGEDHAGNLRGRDQRRTHGVARSVQQLQRVLGNTCPVQQPDGVPGHARRLLGRLGQHGVASDQRSGDLAGKNSQRKIPRADADPDAAPGQTQLVGLAGRPGQRHGLHDALGFARVVAEKIDRFAHFGHRVAPGLASFLDQQRTKHRQLGLQRIGRAAQHGRALGNWRFAPILIAFQAGAYCAGGRFCFKFRNLRQHQPRIGRQQRRAHGFDAQVQPGAVFSAGAIKIRRQRQCGLKLERRS